MVELDMRPVIIVIEKIRGFLVKEGMEPEVAVMALLAMAVSILKHETGSLEVINEGVELFYNAVEIKNGRYVYPQRIGLEEESPLLN